MVDEKELKITDKEKNKEIEELDSLFEDEGDPQFQYAKLFYESDENINFKTDLDKGQLRSMPVAEIGEKLIKDEFDVDVELNILIKTIKEEAVSKKRKGREEAPKFINRGEEQKKKGILKYFGLS